MMASTRFMVKKAPKSTTSTKKITEIAGLPASEKLYIRYTHDSRVKIWKIVKKPQKTLSKLGIPYMIFSISLIPSYTNGSRPNLS